MTQKPLAKNYGINRATLKFLAAYRLPEGIQVTASFEAQKYPAVALAPTG
jgi:hypothetical protein